MWVLELCCNRKMTRALTIQSVIFSKKFDGSQRRYSTIEKETLALLLALKHFDVYLNTTAEPVLIYTDHNPIMFINKVKEESDQCLLRWSLILQQCNIHADQPY